MMRTTVLRTIGMRLFLVLLVLAMIAGFLYISRIARWFDRGKSITVLAWAQEIDAREFAAFEQETGIKVYIRYFENNEELMAKLLATEGYDVDVVMPSDYAAEVFIKKGLIKKIDKSKLAFVDELQPWLLGHYFDPKNEYTIPYYWGVYGIGFDKDYFTNGIPDASWSLLFDKQFAPARIAMPDNARYLALITAYYLFGTIDNLTKEQMRLVKQTLIEQKKIVELYTEARGEYLLASKACALVVLLSVDVAKAMRIFSHVDFVVPREGSFLLIDSFALSAHTQKDELVYQFLNYLYRPEVLETYVDRFTFFPATTTVKPAFQPDTLVVTPDMMRSIDFYRNVIPEPVLSDMWIALKS